MRNSSENINRSRSPNKKNRSKKRGSGNPQNNRNTSQNKPETLQNAEHQEALKNLNYTNCDKISADINRQMHEVMDGVKSLYLFQEKHKEEYPELIEQNQAGMAELLGTNLAQSYLDLANTMESRASFLSSLVNHRPPVLSQAEVNQLQEQNTFGLYLALIDKIKEHPSTPTHLSPADMSALKNTDATELNALLERLKTENKLTDRQQQELKFLGPKNEEETKKVRDQAFQKLLSFDLANQTDLCGQYKQYVIRERKFKTSLDGYKDQYNKYTKQVVKNIEALYDGEAGKERKAQAIDQVSENTGLPIKKGQILYAEDWSVDPLDLEKERECNKKVEIVDITFGGEESSSSEKFPSFEPIIIFKAEAQDGTNQMVEHTFSLSRFERWVVDNNVSQKFNTPADLEASLGWPGLLKPGQKINYQEAKKGSDPSQSELIEKSVTINSIDSTGITLSDEVIIDASSPLNSLAKPRKSKKLKFGEFSRWFKREGIIPSAENLQELNQHLVSLNNQIAQNMEWTDDQKNDPINLSGPLPIFLLSAYAENAPVQIISADDKKIVFADGTQITPQKFLRLVDEEGLITPNQGQLEERLKIATAQGDDKNTKAFNDQIDRLLAKTATPDKTEEKKATKEEEGPKKVGYFKNIWNNTRFMSLMELYSLLSEAPKKVMDKLKDKSERNVAAIGQNFYAGVPYVGKSLSNKFLKVTNSKTADDIKSAKENWDAEGKTVKDILKELYEPSDKVKFRAAMEWLAPKGAIRFSDDERLHQTINKLFPGHFYPEKFDNLTDKKKIKIVIGEQPNPLKGKVKIEDQIDAIFDEEYGEGVFSSIDNSSRGEYDKRMRNYKDNYRDEEFYGIGLKNKVIELLTNFEEGKDCDAAQFEGLLRAAVSGAEFSMEESVMFFISAFGARNKNSPSNQSLIPISKLNTFFGDFKEVPIFSYFTGMFPKVGPAPDYKKIMDATGEKQREGHLDVNEFQQMYQTILKPDFEENIAAGVSKFKAAKHTANWLFETVLTKSKTAEKAADRIGSVDPTYYQYVGPLLTKDSQIEQLVGSGGRENYIILKNVYAGYNAHLKVRSKLLGEAKTPEEKMDRTAQFSEMLLGSIYYDHALSGKIEKEKGYGRRFINFSKNDYEQNPTADKNKTVGGFVNETRSFTEAFVMGLAKINGDVALQEEARLFLSPNNNIFPYDDEANFRKKRVLEAITKARDEHWNELVALAEQCASGLSGLSGQAAAKPKESKN